MDRLPTPEELGDMLKRGEITREEAIEIMDQRARDEAIGTLLKPMKELGPDPAQNKPDDSRSSGNGTGKAAR
ncbi:MAG: hypothetical protein A3K19_21020 [Lentisphaerae bacterium RIFOXYB12_FULL_65_16]|nr:MAG: hypothetical protein A3K18_16515 [Lentisphaerae bacterium RIFOXYA12_64_32]OGV84815.1 MAG: hypothetical protein A3K19_21020 [Lentisphaerae bacterium RIFOXYB12_FULL_65_16]